MWIDRTTPGDRARCCHVAVRASARLHFGLMEICPGQPLLYGGCGLMIRQPATQMSGWLEGGRIPHGPAWEIDSDHPWHHRIAAVLERIETSSFRLKSPSLVVNPSAMVKIRLDVPPLAHAGLGSGTQLACAAASLVLCLATKESEEQPQAFDAAQLWQRLFPSEAERLEHLAELTGRGLRSYVGLAGHLSGGFLADRGLTDPVSRHRIVDRYAVPEDWHVVLVRSLRSGSISGEVERDYFRKCAVPNPHRQPMQTLIIEQMIPALASRNLEKFGDALYRYGQLAGKLFEAVQGGIYRDAAVARLVACLREWGVPATGQSSWGPTVFAIVGGQDEAKEIAERLRQTFSEDVEVVITQPDNQPSRITVDYD